MLFYVVLFVLSILGLYIILHIHEYTYIIIVHLLFIICYVNYIYIYIYLYSVASCTMYGAQGEDAAINKFNNMD